MPCRAVVDVEASRSIRQAEVGTTKTIIERTRKTFDLYPEILFADTAYGSAENLNWLINKEGIVPHIPIIRCPTGKQSAAERG